MPTIKERLRKSCPDCTASSIDTYTQSIRALAREGGLDEVSG